MPEPVIGRGMALLPQADFVNAYGTAETSSTVAFLSPDDRRAILSNDPARHRRLSSVGMPLPTLEFDIRDDSQRSHDVGIRLAGPAGVVPRDGERILLS